MTIKTIKKRYWISLFLILCAVGLPIYAFKIEPRWLKIRTIEVSERPTLRIAHLSDLHFKGDAAWLKSVVAATNALTPDIVCITGDFVESDDHVDQCLDILLGLTAPVIAVKGNHEAWSNIDMQPFRSFCAATGGRFLMNDEFIFKEVHFFGASKTSDVRPIEGDRKVLLCHYPAVADMLNGYQYDLILAGHTHGGQVRLPFVGAIVTPYNTNGYELGVYKVNGSILHVSPGIGTLEPDLRFLCRPEVTILEF